jgi:protein subunit release factor B
MASKELGLAWSLFRSKSVQILRTGTRLQYFSRTMVEIPYVDKTKLQMKFARSSGPGGQHVNKTESKVDLRVNIGELNLPPEVHVRLLELHGGKINKENELVVTSESSRTRQRNYEECVQKLADIMIEASTMPKERNMNSKTKGRFNANRMEEKKLVSRKKESRRVDYE